MSDWECQMPEDNLPKITPGEYELYCERSDKKEYRFGFGKRPPELKLEFIFSIFSGPFQGIELKGYCPFKEKPRAKDKIFRWAVIARRGEQFRPDRISGKQFESKLFRGHVDYTRKKIPGTKHIAPIETQNPEVTELIELLAGDKK